MLVVPALAQEGTLHFNHLTLENGLSESSNSYIYLDSRGFVWLSSVFGLNRFDGSTVRVYVEDPDDSCSMKGNIVQSSFFEIDSSQMWFGTLKAVNVYEWKTDCFHSYQIDSGIGQFEGYISFYLDHDQNLWLWCDKNLYIFNIPTRRFKKIEGIEKEINRVIAMPDQNGYVAHIWTYKLNQSGAEEITLDAQRNVTEEKKVWDSLASRPFQIRDMIPQGDSLLWVVSDDALWKYNVLNHKGQFMELHQTDASCLEFKDDSTLLIGFKKNGLREFSILQEKLNIQYLHQPDNPSSLLNNSINDIYQDKLGGLWISSWGKGVSYTQPRKIKFRTFYPQYINRDIQSFIPVAMMEEKPDVLMCATKSNGFYYFHRTGPGPPEITQVPHIDSKSFPGDVGSSFKDDAGRYWISTYPGLSVFDPRTGKIKHISNQENISLRGIPWHDQSLLFCGQGLVEISGNMDDGFTMKRNENFKDSIQSRTLWVDSKNRLWVGQGLKRLFVFDAKNFKIIDTIAVTGSCSQFIERDSSLWICSLDGLFEVDLFSLQLLKVYTKKTGMPSSSFNSMVMDKHKRLWLTYNQGLVMFDPTTKNKRPYTQQDGLPPLQFRDVSFHFDDDEIWFAANEAVTRFYPDQIHDLDIQAIPQITEIQVNDKLPVTKLVCDLTGATNIPLIQKLTFDSKNNTLAIRVNALEYSSPQQNKVRYQMMGLDEKPVETPSGSLVRYPNLPAREYRFVVYASNSDGQYNEVPRVLIIHITPPFYKTWWFNTLLVLLILSIVGYIIYLRFSKALELQRVRLKLYENLHDDVGSRLTAIVLSAEDLERNEKLDHPKIKSISKIAKSIVENMRRLVWAIDPENDKMNTILEKIMHDKSLILGDHIRFQTKIDEHLKNIIVPGEIRYQISSICNEAFNNISKYAEATAVTVTLSRENRKFRLTITDNGKGFDSTMTSKNLLTGSGYGLNNMKRRASRVKGNLEIFSKPGEGTRIEAEFPY